MSIKKNTLATLLLISLTACSSGGNSSSNTAKSELSSAQNELSTAKQQLTTAQAELTQAQADKATTASQLATAQANLEKAEQAKTEAEGALDNKNKVVAEIVKKAKEALESKGYESERININIWSDSDTANLIKGEIIKSPYIHLTTDSLDGIFVGNQYIYLSPNSDMKLYSRTLTAIWNDSELNSMEKSFRVDPYGTRTTTLPQGTATYQGKAFAASASGDLNYQVDFGAKTGSGSIQNFNAAIPTIRLEQGDITSRGVGENHRIRAAANTEDGLNGRYFLDFYGENAESIGGKLYMYSRFENVPASNGGEANDFNANERGTVFGLVGERQ